MQRRCLPPTALREPVRYETAPGLSSWTTGRWWGRGTRTRAGSEGLGAVGVDLSDLRGSLSQSTTVVVDATGDIYRRLVALDLPSALWRVAETRLVELSVSPTCVVYAAHGAPRWDELEALPWPTLVITTAYRQEDAAEALRHDLVGYLDATMPADVFDRAVRGAVAYGEPAYPRALLGAWMRERRAAAAERGADVPGLTSRQREIMSLIAVGATDKEIASRLGIAQTTAQKHVTKILQRLRVPNRAAAVATLLRAS